MKTMRAFTVLSFTALVGACGEGLAEPNEALASQQMEQQQGAPEEQAREGDIKIFSTPALIAPQDTVDFASLWFTRTQVFVHNTSDTYVQANIWCSRYNYSRAPLLAPGQLWSGLAPCEGTTIHVYNGAPVGSNALLNVTVEN